MRRYEDAGFYDFGWTAPCPDIVDLNHHRSPSNLLYKIIRLFLGGEPEAVILEASLSICFKWILLRVFANLGYAINKQLDHQITAELAHSLEYSKKWEFSVLIWLHTDSSRARDNCIRKVITRNIRKAPDALESPYDFLTEKLLINSAWILEGQARHALDHRNFIEAAKLFILLKKHKKAADIVLEKILPELEQQTSGEMYRALFNVTDSLEAFLVEEEMKTYRPYAPFFEMLQTFGRLQEEEEEGLPTSGHVENVHEILVEKLKEDMECIKALLRCPDLKGRKFIQRTVQEAERYVMLVRRNSSVGEGLFGLVKNAFGKFWG